MIERPEAMVSVKSLLAVTDALSVTCTVKCSVAGLPGVPWIVPVGESSVRSPNEPAVMAHEKGGVPPAGDNVCE